VEGWHESTMERSGKKQGNLREEITADHIQPVQGTNCLQQAMLLTICQQDCKTTADVSKRASPTNEVNEEKCNILKFMGKLKKYFEKRNSLDDYDFIVESIANLSSTGQ